MKSVGSAQKCESVEIVGESVAMLGEDDTGRSLGTSTTRSWQPHSSDLRGICLGETVPHLGRCGLRKRGFPMTDSPQAFVHTPAGLQVASPPLGSSSLGSWNEKLHMECGVVEVQSIPLVDVMGPKKGLGERFDSFRSRAIAPRRAARPSAVEVSPGTITLAALSGSFTPEHRALESFFFNSGPINRKNNGSRTLEPSIESLNTLARCMKI